MYMTVYSAGKKNPKALCVDLVFTVESPKSVNCDAMTNVGSCLDEDSWRRWKVDIVLLKFASDEAAGVKSWHLGTAIL